MEPKDNLDLNVSQNEGIAERGLQEEIDERQGNDKSDGNGKSDGSDRDDDDKLFIHDFMWFPIVSNKRNSFIVTSTVSLLLIFRWLSDILPLTLL